MKCWYTNACSLRNKLDEFRARVKSEQPHVVAVTEVWMKEDVVLDGYHQAVRHDRESGRKGGGILLFVKDNLPMIECRELSKLAFEESVWCLVRLIGSESMLLGLCYRSPSSEIENDNQLLNVLRSTEQVQAEHVLVMGDFNFPQIDWSVGKVDGPEDSSQAQFYEVVQDLFLAQHVDFPTRFRNGQSPSQLDLVLTKHEYAIDEVEASAPLGKSDHLVLTWTYQYQTECSSTQVPDTTLRRNFHKGRYDAMNKELLGVDWSFTESMDVDTMWIKMKELLVTCIEKYVPLVKKKKEKRKTPPWWTKELTKEVKTKYKMWKRYSHLRSPVSHQEYTAQRNKVTRMLRESRRRYEDQIAKEGKQDPQKIHRYIRSQLKIKPKVGALEQCNGTLTSTDSEAAEVLNAFFQSVFVVENPSDIPEFPDVTSDEHALTSIEITESQVQEQLQCLAEGKAAGPDGIPATVLKKCSESITKPLTNLYRKTLEAGRLPNEWKAAKITPIYKKGSKLKAENYRPVSLTSQTCKVLERLILKHIKKHLSDNELISEHQHGFQQGRSCQTNLLETFELLTKWLDAGKGIDIVYLDYQKAFDKVPHLRLIKKLNAYGIRGSVLHWIRDFFSDRRQQVAVGCGESSWTRVTSGVPQGSVLGPTLFVIYINEIPKIIKSKCKLFADDTKLFHEISNDEDVSELQSDLDELTKWSAQWLLKFNTEKCKVMHCGHSNPAMEYVMNELHSPPRVLKTTKMEHDLGVVVSEDLKATLHCQAAAAKANKALRLLRMAFSNVTVRNFKLLYSTYVRPHLDYCLQAVGPHMMQDLQKLEKVQRRATKIVKTIKSLSYQERLSTLKLLSMKDRLLRGDLIEVYKIMTGKVNIDRNQFFELHEDLRTRGHPLKLKKRRTLHHFRNKFFANRVVTTWNSLPEHVVAAMSVNSFKRKLDQLWATKSLTS